MFSVVLEYIGHVLQSYALHSAAVYLFCRAAKELRNSCELLASWIHNLKSLAFMFFYNLCDSGERMCMFLFIDQLNIGFGSH